MYSCFNDDSEAFRAKLLICQVSFAFQFPKDTWIEIELTTKYRSLPTCPVGILIYLNNRLSARRFFGLEAEIRQQGNVPIIRKRTRNHYEDALFGLQ